MLEISSVFPKHRPKRMYAYREHFAHHLMLRMAEEGIAAARNYLSQRFPTNTGAHFECTPEEGEKAFLHRFAAAGAAIRYRAVHRDDVQEIVALDVALPRNGTDWFEHLPERLALGCIISFTMGTFLPSVSSGLYRKIRQRRD